MQIDMNSKALSYASGTSEQPLLGITIGDMFDQIVDQYPDNEALIVRHQDIRYTYRQLKEKVDECARALLSLGLKKGERSASGLPIMQNGRSPNLLRPKWARTIGRHP